jgi:hypothetical protein
MSRHNDTAEDFDCPRSRETGVHHNLVQTVLQDYSRFREAFQAMHLDGANFLPDLRIGAHPHEGHHHFHHGHSRWYSPEFWSHRNEEEMPDYHPGGRNENVHRQLGQAVDQLNDPQQQANDGRFPTGRGNYPQELLNSCPPGFAGDKWSNPDYHTIKYDVGRNMAQVQDQLHAIPDEAGQKQFMQDFLKSQIPVIEANGGRVIAIKGEAICLDAGDGPHWIDTVQDIGGTSAIQWTAVGGDIPPQQDFGPRNNAVPTEQPRNAFNWSPELLNACPPGYDAGKWSNPNYHTPKYDVSRNLAAVQDQLHAIPDEPGRKAFMEKFLATQKPLIEAEGYRVVAIKNEKIQLDDGRGNVHWVDCARDIGGDAAVQWLA